MNTAFKSTEDQKSYVTITRNINLANVVYLSKALNLSTKSHVIKVSITQKKYPYIIIYRVLPEPKQVFQMQRKPHV